MGLVGSDGPIAKEVACAVVGQKNIIVNERPFAIPRTDQIVEYLNSDDKNINKVESLSGVIESLVKYLDARSPTMTDNLKLGDTILARA